MDTPEIYSNPTLIPAHKHIGRILLFTGHMIDAPDRKEPRFPVSKTPIAAAAIAEAVRNQTFSYSGELLGIASCASGGDILFHEACNALGIDTVVCLALPPREFVARSVANAGREWIDRFDAITRAHPTFIFDQRTAQEVEQRLNSQTVNVWQQTNLWMLREALRLGSDNLTVIALWNQQHGDGPGGTADLIAQATKRGAHVVMLDTNVLFELQQTRSNDGQSLHTKDLAAR